MKAINSPLTSLAIWCRRRWLAMATSGKVKLTWLTIKSVTFRLPGSRVGVFTQTGLGVFLPAFPLALLADFWGRTNLFVPEAVAGAMDENIFQRWLTHAQRLNFPGECFDYIRHKAMSIFNFQADLIVHHGGIDMKLAANAVCECLRLACFEQNNVASDFAREDLRRPEGDKVTFIQNGEAVAAFGFFHQVSSDDDGDPLLIAQDLKILPKVVPGSGIKAGSGFVEEQDFGMMEQALG